ncbi:hypothetical protein G6F63_016795 [Rhizopus arrhizus]|nr:hypothetical protein G6F63_016795 [Rhizopus arrhizus]
MVGADCAVTYDCCWALVALCAALASACAVAWYRLPTATAGASPSTLVLAWVTESVIWSFTAVGNAMAHPTAGQARRPSGSAGLAVR